MGQGLDCRVEKGVTDVEEDNFSPAKVFDGMFDGANSNTGAPLSGAKRVFEGFTSNHGASSLQVLGYDDYVAASAQYGSQAGHYSYTFIGRYRDREGSTPEVVLRNCGDIGTSGSAVMGQVAGKTHLWAIGSSHLYDVDVTDAVIVSDFYCSDCDLASLSGPYGEHLIDAGGELIAVVPWGNNLGVVTIDKASGATNSAVVTDSGGVVLDVPGQLWTVDSKGALIHWDPHAGKALATIPSAVGPGLVPAEESGGGTVRPVLFAGSHFWTFTTGANGEIAQRDPATFAVTNRATVPNLVGVYSDSGHLWVTSFGDPPDAVVREVDVGSAQLGQPMTIRSFLGMFTREPEQRAQPFVPELQVDAKGFWFVMPDPPSPAGTTATSLPDLNIMMWGPQPMYRWETPA